VHVGTEEIYERLYSGRQSRVRPLTEAASHGAIGNCIVLDA
jgi:hypothetical protein